MLSKPLSADHLDDDLDHDDDDGVDVINHHHQNVSNRPSSFFLWIMNDDVNASEISIA